MKIITLNLRSYTACVCHILGGSIIDNNAFINVSIHIMLYIYLVISGEVHVYISAL